MTDGTTDVMIRDEEQDIAVHNHETGHKITFLCNASGKTNGRTQSTGKMS